MNKKNRKPMSVDELTDKLRKHGLTRAQFRILGSVWLGVNGLKHVCWHAEWMGELDEPPRITKEEYESALNELLALGYLQIFTKAIIREIELALISEPSLGPSCRLPDEGSVEFTPTGAELYMRIKEKVHGLRAGEFCSIVSADVGDLNEVTIIASSRAEAKKMLEKQIKISQVPTKAMDYKKPPPTFIAASNPIRIGLWRDRWWRKPTRAWLLKAIFVKKAKQAE